MKKEKNKISSPDELNKNLTYNSPITWVVLGAVIVALIGFFAWSMIYKIPVDKISGKANISNGTVSLHVEEDKLDELKEGQKVYISGKEGKISSIGEDKQPVVYGFSLPDGDYDYDIVLKEMKPIEFWFNNK